jgi:hypothetical protein
MRRRRIVVSKETLVFQQKRMFKVISPIEMKGGGTYWLRCGTGFVNKDNSINVYLDAMPLRTKDGEGVTLQLREFTDEELRERADKKATYAARGTLNFPSPNTNGPAQADSVPF